MADTLPLLLEIGVEELPSSFVDGALAALPGLIRQAFSDLRIAHGAVRVYGTPRRLGVTVEGVAPFQADLDEEVIGPPESAAFKDGKPTKAAEAFAAKLGLSVDQLQVLDREGGPKQKAGRYVVGRRKEKGRPARDLLGATLTGVCAAIPFRKSMRWGHLSVEFGRPVQWLVALLGKDVLDMSFAGVHAGRTSRGHRFLSPATFSIHDPSSYESLLRKAHVLADREQRANIMLQKVQAAARAVGGHPDPDPALIEENVTLVEEPHVLTGSFDPSFLKLPAAVIRAVARGHQKYFCVQRNDDELLPHYVCVANTAERPDLVVKGNDRVMRARLSDAQFFFEEDQKVRLDTRAAKLGGIVFHHRLGTVADKVVRLTALSSDIAQMLSVAPETHGHIETAARLCKADLVSLMVGEFPELQGHMGRAYARHEGQPPVVADALRDHYRPVGASDDVPTSDVAAIVALADRLDTLVGCFAVGLSPTGAADPYALRRACIAILRILTETPSTTLGYASLRLGDLLERAYEKLKDRKLDLSKEDTVKKVEAFAEERLRALLAAKTNTNVADAVLGGVAYVQGFPHGVVHHPVYAVAKATALKAVVDRQEPWLAKAKLVTKRLSGISRETEPLAPKPGLMRGAVPAKTASDEAILSLVGRIDESTRQLHDVPSVQRALSAMGEAADRLDEIFTQILVNDPEDPDTAARLGVLSYGARAMQRIADFAHLG